MSNIIESGDKIIFDKYDMVMRIRELEEEKERQKVFKIKGCSDCPLRNLESDHMGYYCNHPEAEYQTVDKIAPEWCPLIKQALTIELIKDE